MCWVARLKNTKIKSRAQIHITGSLNLLTTRVIAIGIRSPPFNWKRNILPARGLPVQGRFGSLGVTRLWWPTTGIMKTTYIDIVIVSSIYEFYSYFPSGKYNITCRIWIIKNILFIFLLTKRNFHFITIIHLKLTLLLNMLF